MIPGEGTRQSGVFMREGLRHGFSSGEGGERTFLLTLRFEDRRFIAVPKLAGSGPAGFAGEAKDHKIFHLTAKNVFACLRSVAKDSNGCRWVTTDKFFSKVKKP